jgi:hypothetical protein
VGVIVEAADILASLRERGVTVVLEAGKLRIRPWVSLPADERRDAQKHWKEIIALLQAEAEPAPAPQPKLAPEPVPEVYAYGHRVTEQDVTEALMSLGDEVVGDYRAGRMTKREAYDIARHRLRQYRELSRL